MEKGKGHFFQKVSFPPLQISQHFPRTYRTIPTIRTIRTRLRQAAPWQAARTAWNGARVREKAFLTVPTEHRWSHSIRKNAAAFLRGAGASPLPGVWGGQPHALSRRRFQPLKDERRRSESRRGKRELFGQFGQFGQRANHGTGRGSGKGFPHRSAGRNVFSPEVSGVSCYSPVMCRISAHTSCRSDSGQEAPEVTPTEEIPRNHSGFTAPARGTR